LDTFAAKKREVLITEVVDNDIFLTYYIIKNVNRCKILQILIAGIINLKRPM
jgi:hypothetical protein